MANRKQIINPNKISKEEMEFLTPSLKNNTSINNDKVQEKKERFKKVLLSMPESFVDELNNYLSNNPTEGRKSSFVVRVVAEYIADKRRYI